MSRAPSHPEVEFLRPPGLAGVELRYSCYRTSAFRTHTHPSWSVGLIESGSTTFTLSGRSYRAEAGDMVVIGPGRAHACNPDPDATMVYRMFYLSPEWLAPRLPGKAFPSFKEPVLGDAALYAQWLDVWQRLTDERRSTATDRSGDADDDGGLPTAVRTLVDRHASAATTAITPRTLGAIDAAKRVLEHDLATNVTLEGLAREVGMSRSHLSRVFSAVVGLPPHTYRNQMRVERARELLAGGTSPAEVSSACGFSDQAHFSRVFREFTGATPVQYQAGAVG